MAAYLLTSISRFLADTIGDAPTSGIPTGSRTYAKDEKIWYIFDGTVWTELTGDLVGAVDLDALLTLSIGQDTADAILGADAPTVSNVFVTASALSDALTSLLSALPASDPAVAGDLWNNGGVLTVSAG